MFNGSIRYDSEEYRAILNKDGGPGSGNWGHAGVPGQRGGSAPTINKSELKNGFERHENRGMTESMALQYNAKGTSILAKNYESHRKTNNLNLVPYSDLGNFEGIRADYTGVDSDVAYTMNATLEDLTSQYDSMLTKIEPSKMPGNIPMSVRPDYTTSSAVLELNVIDCDNAEYLASKTREAMDKGHFPNVPEGKEIAYLTAHEFAHTLITNTKLNDKTNWVNSDYEKLRDVQKKCNDIYEKYVDNVQRAENTITAIELRMMTTNMSQEEWSKASAEVKQLKEYVKVNQISTYAEKNTSEFIADCFASEYCGGKSNEYTKKVMDVINDAFMKGDKK